MVCAIYFDLLCIGGQFPCISPWGLICEGRIAFDIERMRSIQIGVEIAWDC